MYETAGKIKLINDTQTFPSGFSKREFVVTTGDGKYPQDLKFEMVKDKCAMLDDFSVDQEVQVNFDIRGNEYQGKYYVNLSCWKLQAQEGGSSSNGPSSSPAAPRQASSPAGGPSSEPSPADLRKDDDFDDDDIPF